MLLLALFLFVIGTIIGSFLSVVIMRLNTGEKGILWGRSQCPECHKQLGARELIPLISFFLQRGRCSSCKQKISFHYPLLELITGLLLILLFIRFPFVNYDTLIFPELGYFLLYGIFFSTLMAIAFSDVLFMEFPIVLVIIVAILGIGIATIEQHLWTLGTGWSLLLAAGVFGSQWLFSRGKWLASGDLYLALVFAITLPFALFLITIFFAYISGAIVAIVLLIHKVISKKSRIPFTPFLVFGALISVLFHHYVLFF